MKTRFALSHKKDELAKALKPYIDDWDEWIDSHACFLSVREIVLIRIYQKTGSYAICAGKLQSDIVTIANDLIKVMTRLSLLYDEFKNWQTFRFLQKRGVYTYSNEADYFVNAPILVQPVSQRLKTRFKIFKEETFLQILRVHSEQELKSDFNLDDASISELKKVLSKHNLGYLLKERAYFNFSTAKK